MLTTLALTLLFAAPAEWPQWRGPTRDGQIAAGAAWPNDLKALAKVWQSPKLGPSYSGPILTAKLIYTTETVDKKTEVVTAFDRGTGTVVWTQKWDGAMSVPFFAASNGSWIRSTPACDGTNVYVAGIRDKLVCLDATSGEIRWALDCMKEFSAELPAFGCVCSPILDDSAVYIQAGGGLLKIEKATGKVLWRVLPEKDSMMGSAFASPVFGTIADERVLFVQTRSKLAAVSPDSGKTIFETEIPSFRGMNILDPTPYANGLFTSTYGGVTQFITLTGKSGGVRAEQAWKFKYEGNMTSPIIIKDHAYVFGKDQKFVCVDLKAGKEKWRSDRTYGKYWSLVANGDRILALDSRGILYLLAANPKNFELLGETKLGTEETWAHLAVAGDEIVIRSLNQLTVYKWSK